MKRKIIAIVGPTASGKTGIGVKLAKDFNGEIISADSRQIFRGLDIGTAKDLAEYNGMPYHMIDICDPGEDFSMFKWLDGAKAAIEDIFSRGKTPIVVGGTGLYIQALVQGFCLEQVSSSKFQVTSNGERSTLGYSREELNTKTNGELQEILKRLDLETYEKIDLNNPHRLIRAIERAQNGEKTLKVKPNFEVLQIGLKWPRETLYDRIDKRVDDRFEHGMLEEVAGLLNSGVKPEWLLKLGLEYKIITDFIISNSKFLISNQISNDQILELKTLKQFGEMKQELKWKSHQYARRQEIWFRRFPEIVWESDDEKIKNIVSGYLA